MANTHQKALAIASFNGRMAKAKPLESYLKVRTKDVLKSLGRMMKKSRWSDFCHKY